MGDTRTAVRRRAIAVASIAVLVATLTPVLNPGAGAQAASQVVISEIHYHPVGDEDAEFVELTNTGPGAIDIGEWCLDSAVDFCFPAGTSLGNGAAFVIARDAAVFEAAAGEAPDFVYTSRLANDDEEVVLVNAEGNLVDSVRYDSTGLWPVTPDGQGPSLERIDLSIAAAGPRAWAASTGIGGTPGRANSAAGSGLPPLVTAYANTQPAPGTAVTVSAETDGATSAKLEYRYDFGSVSEVLMSQVGGEWRATIPARNGGLVRYRIVASGANGIRTSPRPDDTVNWWGYVIDNPASTPLPELRWFMEEGDFDRVFDNPWDSTPCGDGLCPSVVEYDGQVWDNVGFRAAGLTTRNASKKNYRLDFPAGHRFDPDFFDRAVDVVTIDSQTPNYEALRERLSWEFMRANDIPSIETQHVHTRRNSDFFGLYLIREEQDGLYRSRAGWDEGEMYKFEAFGAKRGWGGTWEKNEGLEYGEDNLDDLLSCLNGSVSTRRNCLPEKMDLPQVINELAAIWATRQIDQREFNWMLWYDRTGTGLWQLFPDDLDRSMGGSLSDPTTSTQFVYDRCLGLDNTAGNEVCRAVMSVPEYEAMVYRRIRTLADGLLDDPRWVTELRQLEAAIAQDWDADEAIYNRTSVSLGRAADELAEWFGDYAQALRNGGSRGRVPGEQPTRPDVRIDGFVQNNGDGVEWLRLDNRTNATVDVSDWTVTGLGSIPKGTAIEPGGNTLLVVAEQAWRAAGGDTSLVRAQVSGGLGPIVSLVRPDGSVADTDGAIIGSPLVLNEWNAVADDETISGGDAVFGAVPGNGGDWFELVVVEERTDVRGWRLVLSEKDGDGRSVTDVLVFSADPVLADLRAGTIITVNEDRPDDVSFSPIDGDWTLDFQAADGAPGAFFTAGSQQNFDTNADDWQLAIVDAGGNVVFGPVGEGTGDVGGVGKSEVGELEVAPQAGVGPESGYDDGDASTWGQPNVTAGTPQDFGPLRSWFGDPDQSGATDAADVQFILESLAGRTPVVDSDRSDIDLDGQVTLLDALRLARALNG